MLWTTRPLVCGAEFGVFVSLGVSFLMWSSLVRKIHGGGRGPLGCF